MARFLQGVDNCNVYIIIWTVPGEIDGWLVPNPTQRFHFLVIIKTVLLKFQVLYVTNFHKLVRIKSSIVY